MKAKQWSSTLDTHTSQWCIIRDRKLYTLDGKPLGHTIPYLRGPGKIHFCCRSCEILITKSWEEMQIASGELSSVTRASMDGQVPAHTSYAEWLARQPYARQEQVLGVTRAQMLRDGKITVPEMFNDAGEYLTWTNCAAWMRRHLRDRVCVMMIFTAWAMAVADEGCL